MTIEQSKRYITLRMICGNVVITPMQIISKPNLDSPFTRITYIQLNENGRTINETQYIFIDTKGVRPLNEHCLRLQIGHYIVDSKQEALKTLYHLTKRKFYIGEGKTPFQQNFLANSDRLYVKGYYEVCLNQLKRITL